MPGGLLQIASSGIQDQYLTKNPQITFFKKVYRRHTNFSKEVIEINVDNVPDFGQDFFINVPKNGDLVHKAFLQVEVSPVEIDDSYITNSSYLSMKNSKLKNLQNTMEFWKNEYDNLKKYSEIQIDYYTKLMILLQSDDINYDVIYKKTQIDSNMWSNTLNNIIFKLDEDLKDDLDIIGYVLNLNVKFGLVDSSENNTVSHSTFKTNVDTVYNNNIKLLKYYYSNYIYYSKASTEVQNGKINYAWVKNLGHHYFSNFEVELDGEQIERYSNDYFNIYQSHNLYEDYIPNYNEMIGNVDSVNKFDGIKQNNLLYIPLIFWFTRNSSFSVPLVSMKNSNLQFNFTLNNLSNLIYFEDYEFEFNEITTYELPFADHVNNSKQAKSLWDTNSDVSNVDISKTVYDSETKIYYYKFKYITKELLKLKFIALSSSQIDKFFTKYSSNLETIDLDEWIKFRLDLNETDSDLITVSENLLYYNHPNFVNFNYLTNKIKKPEIKLYLEYIFLDEIERFKFSKNNLEYISSFPYESVSDIDNQSFFSSDLNLLKPSKDMIWFLRPKVNKNGYSKYSSKNPNLYNKLFLSDSKIVDKLNVNLQDNMLIDFKYGENFYLYATKYGKLNRIGPLDDSNYYYFAFSLFPENDQPSGSVNFSIIKGKTIQIILNSDFLNKYFDTNINSNNQNIELVVINNYYSLLNFSKGKGQKIYS